MIKVPQFCEYIQTYWIIRFKQVNFMKYVNYISIKVLKKTVGQDRDVEII